MSEVKETEKYLKDRLFIDDDTGEVYVTLDILVSTVTTFTKMKCAEQKELCAKSRLVKGDKGVYTKNNILATKLPKL